VAIKKFNRKEADPDYYSKTQNKNEANALTKFGHELVELPIAKIKALPVEEVTRQSLLDYQKITTNLARKRHFMFIGKCLRSEDEPAIRKFLDESTLQAAKEKPKAEKVDPMQAVVDELLKDGEQSINLLLEAHPSMARQTLRQYLRNIQKAKTPEKKNQAVAKLKTYLNDNQ
jgi:ribosome-associated protein